MKNSITPQIIEKIAINLLEGQTKDYQSGILDMAESIQDLLPIKKHVTQKRLQKNNRSNQNNTKNKQSKSHSKKSSNKSTNKNTNKR